MNDKLDKIVEARMRLRARFEKKMQGSPALSDETPQGSGPLNRHGMPQLPPGQTQAKNWPVLDLGIKPDISKDEWKLEVRGEVAADVDFSWASFMSLPQVEDVSDFHCVTTWSKMDIHWRGVRFADLAAAAGVREQAAYILVHGYDGYTTNLPLYEALKDDVLLVHEANGEPLAREHGGPLRMITPQLYAWKGAKWISAIEFLEHDEPGFWEQRGYSNSAHPWRNDRYS